ncbi:hypothetical protein ACJX0J_007338, partial [Zea mays]
YSVFIQPKKKYPKITFMLYWHAPLKLQVHTFTAASNPFNFLDMVWYGNNNKHIFIGSNNTTGKLKMKQMANIWSHIKCISIVKLTISSELFLVVFITFLNPLTCHVYVISMYKRARIAFQQEKSQYEYQKTYSWKDCEGKNKSPQKAQWHKLKRKVILGILGLSH